MYNKIVKNSYNSVAEDWNNTRKGFHWNEFDFLYEELNFLGGKNFNFKNNKILDLGCGTGRLFDFFESKGLKSENYLGVDLSEKMLKESIKNYPNNKYFSGDVSKKNFLEDFEEKFYGNYEKKIDLKFDQIWCIAMFHHLGSKKNRIQAIKNFNKILNKDGRLILTVWNFFQPEILNGKKNRLYKKFGKILKKSFWRFLFSFGFYSKQDCFFYWRDSNVLRYYYAFRKNEIIRLFEENGFKVEFFDEGKNFSLILKK